MTYPGGKHGSGVYQQIINKIPPHELYVEPFLGGGAIMLMKRPAAGSIGIDIDPQVINIFPPGVTPNLTLLQSNAITWLSTNSFRSPTFIYIDPPYLLSTRRSSKRLYSHELPDEDHQELLRVIKTLTCMVMISGYPNDLYDDALSRWWTHTFKTTNRGHGHVTEKLWMNYPPPSRLHDYRYLGTNFRDRERLKKKKLRWTTRLLKMPAVERSALAAAIAELDESGQYRQIQRTAPAEIAENTDTTRINK